MSISLVDDDAGVFSQVVETLKREMNPMSNGVLFHTKCVCNLLISMVKSTLDYAATVISKVQKMVDSVYYSEVRYDFTEFVQSKGEKFSEPCFAALPEKWNTTHRMLDFIFKQRSLLAEFFAKSGKKDFEDNDWEKIEALLGILEVFRSSTVLLCNAYNATIPLVLGQSLLISNMFKQYKENPFWKPLISDLQSKFLKYYETMAPIFYCASVLNPTIGVGGVENIFEDIEVNLGLNGAINIAKCGEILREVFDYYDTMYNKSKTRALVPAIASSTCTSIILQSVSRKTSKAVTISNDLELYTKTDFSNLMRVDEYEDLNILEWWKTKGCNQYPILATMVRDILTIQASTVASEHAFFLEGRVLDQTRSELSTKTFELRIFLNEHFNRSEHCGKANLVEDSSGESEEDEDEDLLENGYVNSDEEDEFYLTKMEPVMDSDSD